MRWEYPRYRSMSEWFTGHGIELLLLAGVFLYACAAPYPTAYTPLCPFHNLTGLPCPGCGLGRSFIAAAHGELLAALRHNLLVLFFFPFLAWRLVQRVSATFFRRYPTLVLPRGASAVLAIVIVVFAVVRILFILVGIPCPN